MKFLNSAFSKFEVNSVANILSFLDVITYTSKSSLAITLILFRLGLKR